MSNSPYQPPVPPSDPYGYPPGVPMPDLLRPARYAGTMMIIMGLLMGLFTGCGLLGAAVIDHPQMPPQHRQMVAEFEQRTGMSMKSVLRLSSIIIAVPAVLMVVLGIFQRKGGLGVTVSSIVLTSLILVVLVMGILRAVAFGAISDACFAIVMVGLFGLQMYWLVRAVTSAGPLKAFNAQHQEYQWQMAQHARAQQQAYQQMYQQQGYNYPPPPPLPPGQGPDQPKQGS